MCSLKLPAKHSKFRVFNVCVNMAAALAQAQPGLRLLMSGHRLFTKTISDHFTRIIFHQ